MLAGWMECLLAGWMDSCQSLPAVFDELAESDPHRTLSPSSRSIPLNPFSLYTARPMLSKPRDQLITSLPSIPSLAGEIAWQVRGLVGRSVMTSIKAVFGLAGWLLAFAC